MERSTAKFPCVSRYECGGPDEILQPALIIFSDERCYRKVTHSFGKTGDFSPQGSTHVYGSAYTDDCFDEGEGSSEIELDGVEPLTGGRGYSLSLPIPPAFYKYIIGRQGSTKSSIERETNTKIRVPQRGKEGNIVIEGETISRLADAKRRLEIIMWSNRLKEPITHFICIPLNHPIIMERMEEFKKQVLATCSKDRGISKEVFQIPAKLHLTIGVMRLFTDEELEKAKSILDTCIIEAREQLGDETVMIKLSGIDTMNDDPSAVNVLFARVSSNTRLQKFVDRIVASFMEKAPDLMSKEFERTGVKLHVTIMNSKFKEKSDAQSRNLLKGKRETFDATRVFKGYKGFTFDEIPLQYLHLSKRGEYGPDGFYQCMRQYLIDTITCG